MLRVTIVDFSEIKKESSSHWLFAFVFVVFFVGNFSLKPVLYGALFFVYIIFSFFSWGAVFRILSQAKILFLTYVVLAFSYFWSLVPELTLSAIQSQFLFFVFCLLVLSKHVYDDFSKSLKNAAACVVVFVAVYCAIFPGQSYSPVGLSAFFGHKNALGGVMALCSIVLISNLNRTKAHIFLACISIFLLLASQSKTAILLFFVCVILEKVSSRIHKIFYGSSSRLLVVDVVRALILFGAILSLFLMVVFRDDLLRLIASYIPKTLFTGRGMLWLVVLQQIRFSSFLGVGPGVFWQGGAASEIAQTYLYKIDPHWVQHMMAADGSYVDIIASIGFFGLAMFLLSVIHFYSRLFNSWGESDRPLVFMLFTFILLHAVTESTILHSTNVFWLIYIMCYLRVVSFGFGAPNIMPHK